MLCFDFNPTDHQATLSELQRSQIRRQIKKIIHFFLQKSRLTREK